MTSALEQYISSVAAAVQTENGIVLADLTDPLMPQDWVDMLAPELAQIDQSTLEARISAIIPSPFHSHILAFLAYLKTPDPRDYYDAAASVFAQFCNPVFSREWQVPVLRKLCEGLIHLALERDAYLKSLGKKGTTSTNLQNRFSWLMSLILVDRPGFGEIKAAALLVANIALRFYVRIDEWQLCSKLIRQIDQRRLDLSTFPMSQRVTYHFLVGRLKLYYHKFRAAEKHLAFALQHCHKDSVANRRRIFPLILVARMVRGMLPRTFLLEKYGLAGQFGPLIAAFKQGNFSEYNSVLHGNARHFASLGVFYILEQRTRILTFRNLFRAVHLISKAHKPDSAGTQLDYSQLQRACVFAGVSDMDIAGVESIVVALIAQGYMKGYTLPGRGLVVVSKNNPFPAPCHLSQARKSKKSFRRVSHPPRRPSRKLSLGAI